MKFGLNKAFTKASGELDGLIYRTVRGKVVAARKPDMSNVVYTESQIAHRKRFKQATVYGKSVMANEEVRPLYEAAAKEKNIPVFAITIADFFNAPEIHNVDVTNYHGSAGDKISILASDDFGVASVHVTLKDGMGNPIESGEAIESVQGSGQWIYTVTTTSGSTVTAQVVAMDRPGGTAVKTVNLAS